MLGKGNNGSVKDTGRSLSSSVLILTISIFVCRIIFVLKEAFFVSLPLVYIMIFSFLIITSVVIAIPVAIAYYALVAHSPSRKKMIKRLVAECILPAMREQLLILVSLPLSVSTTWRYERQLAMHTRIFMRRPRCKCVLSRFRIGLQ